MNIDKGFAEYDQPHESQTNKDILETIVRWDSPKYSSQCPWMAHTPKYTRMLTLLQEIYSKYLVSY